MIEGTSNLLKHATEFYKEQFGPASGNLCRLKENMWEPNYKLSNIVDFILTRPFSEPEIKNALFSMKNNKAPGLDNMPIEFFTHGVGSAYQ